MALQNDDSMNWAIDPKVRDARRGYKEQALPLPAGESRPAPKPVASAQPAPGEPPANYADDSISNRDGALPSSQQGPNQVDFAIGEGKGSVSSGYKAGMDRVKAGLADPDRMKGVSAMPDDQTSASNTKILAHQRGMEALRKGGAYQDAYDQIANPQALQARQAQQPGFDVGALWQQANRPIDTGASISDMMVQARNRKNAMALLGQLMTNQGQLATTQVAQEGLMGRAKLGAETDLAQTGMMAGASRYNAALDAATALSGQRATAEQQALTRQGADRKSSLESGARQYYMDLMERASGGDADAEAMIRRLSDDNGKGKLAPNTTKIQGEYERMISQNPTALAQGGLDPSGPTNITQAGHIGAGIKPGRAAIDRPWYSLSLDQQYAPSALALPSLAAPNSQPVLPEDEARQPKYRQAVKGQ